MEEIRNLSEILQEKNEEISQMSVDFAGVIKDTNSQIERQQAEKSQTHFDFNEKKEEIQITDRDLEEANLKIQSLERKLEVSVKKAEGMFSDLQKIAVVNVKTLFTGP
ncbi:unnamed protein product [Caenorhabditis nigoni]